ncbi:MAG: hypothetical protein HBSIN02_15100 [Bacteroidia bacterium]|nr:MAG: hypothetical protein HBSIN02_15100 [Bacteroidia bacterium]
MNHPMLAVAVLAFSVAVGQDFEGSVTFRVTGQENVQSIKYLTKGNKIRLEAQEGEMQVVILMDVGVKSITMVMPAARMYMEMPMDMGSDGPENLPTDFRMTGKKETILGYACEQAVIRQAEGETEVWVTKGLGRFLQAGFPARSSSPVMKRIEEELVQKGFFPLRMITRPADGSGEMRMEATKIEKSRLADELFSIPTGYQKMSMPPRQ